MFRSFMRSTAPIALLLVVGICATFAVLVLPVSTSTVGADGVELSSGPDATTMVLVGSLTVVGVLAFVAAGFLAYRRRSSRR